LLAYAVRVEANGIEIQGEDPKRPIVGFFATRMVRAQTSEEAERLVAEMIIADWSRGEWALVNRGSIPILSVDEVWVVSLWRWLWFKNRGHVFFPRDD
jgi:hypothetical protein